jgi:hypothetical protein
MNKQNIISLILLSEWERTLQINNQLTKHNIAT